MFVILSSAWKARVEGRTHRRSKVNVRCGWQMRGRTLRTPYRGARLARMRCKVRRCMFSRRAVSETLWPQSS